MSPVTVSTALPECVPIAGAEAHAVIYAVGRERGHFTCAGETLAFAIRISRIFRRTQDGWRQVHHHGSIDDPGLLARYQRAVLGR